MKWTEEDIKILKASLLVHPIPEVAKRLGRGVFAVKKKMTQLGLKSTVRTITTRTSWWTEKEVSSLKVWVSRGWPTKKIAKKLGKSEKAVRIKASRLGISLEFEAWSEQEVEDLTRMVKEGASWKEISAHLGRSITACENKGYRLLLKKPKWTDSEIEKLLRLKTEGHTWKHIASELGRKKTTVMKKYQRLPVK